VQKDIGMAFIIRRDCAPGQYWPPAFAERVFGLETRGRATAISFVRDRAYAKRFESRQEAQQIAETFVVGPYRLIVELEWDNER
jgi:hypothetical protein